MRLALDEVAAAREVNRRARNQHYDEIPDGDRSAPPHAVQTRRGARPNWGSHSMPRRWLSWCRRWETQSRTPHLNAKPRISAIAISMHSQWKGSRKDCPAVWVLNWLLVEHVHLKCDGAALDDVVVARQRQRRQVG